MFKALSYLKDKLQCKPSTLSHYRIGWSFVKKFMDANKIDFISASVCENFISDLCEARIKSDLSVKERRAIQAILVLSEFIETGEIQKRKKFKYLEGNIGKIIQQYISFKQPDRLSPITIRQNERNLSKFNFWLSTNNIHNISDINQSHVIQFIQALNPNQKGCVNNTLMNLRGFFKYLFKHDLITTNIATRVPRDNYKSLAKLPAYYSENEISQVLKCLDRGTTLGKRDYAVFMLAMRLGMRASDIANLKFENLHWDISSIIFKQHKGGKDTKLPLIPAVGNAILDYIEYGRPKSNESYVFLVAMSPHPPIIASTVGGIVTRRFRNADLNTRNRKLGSHVLRHSLVKQLLENKQTLPVITEVLGHKSQESTRHYIRIDLEALRKCALDVPPVNPGFYSQGKGIFFN